VLSVFAQKKPMDGLAAEGIRFEKAYSANPVWVPSRMSMATGMMPGSACLFFYRQ